MNNTVNESEKLQLFKSFFTGLWMKRQKRRLNRIETRITRMELIITDKIRVICVSRVSILGDNK